ncbi:MAG TPA: sigma-70 family RNA polymerase sigma factor [Gemmataceae bacterium]|jgi:RNA polymerase sigma factor (sigma-70 family)|nr:sigma-70 family RNA polymerase sigma factor [Gemmataceae bacterium]
MPASHVRAETILQHVRALVGSETTRDLTDGDLLHRFAVSGEEAAFAALVRRHGRLVLDVCRQVLRQEQDAEDAFQATFLVLARRAGSIQKGEAVGSWLYGVAYRTAMSARKAAARRRRREHRPEERTPEQPVSEAALRELQNILSAEVQRLPEKYRVPFVLCCLEGKSKAEVARELGWKEGTVSSRLAQARKRLQEQLQRRGVALSAALCAVAVATGSCAAAVPVGLTAAVLAGALSFARGRAAGAASQAVLLAEDVLHTMFLTKVKLGAVLVLVAGVVAAGAGLAAQGLRNARPEEPPTPQANAVNRPPAVVRHPPARTDCYGDPLPPGAIARMGTVRFRDAGSSLVYTPDGKALIVDGARLWDASTGKLLRRLLSFTDWPSNSVLAPDQKTLARTTGDGSIELWDLATGARLRSWETPGVKALLAGRRDCRCLAYSPDGRLLATSGQDGVLRLWDPATSREVRQLTGAKACEHPMAFSPDGRTVAYGHFDKTVRVCETATGKECVSFTADPKGVWCLSFSPDSKVLATTQWSPERTLCLWDAATGKELRRLTGKKDGADSIAFAPDGRTLAAGCSDGSIRLWEVATGKELRRFRGHGRLVSALAFSPDGKSLASSGSDGVLRQWHIATGKELHPPAGHAGGIRSLALSADGRLLATASQLREVRLWDARTGKELRRIYGPEVGGGVVAFSPDGRLLLSNGKDSAIHIWDAATAKEHRPIRLQDEWSALWLAVSPDGQTLAASLSQKLQQSKVTLWDMATGKELRSLEAPGSLIIHLTFSPDGGSVFGTGFGRHDWQVRVHVWDVGGGKERRRYDTGPELVRPAAFSPDGRWFARADSVGNAGRFEDVIRLWDLGTGKEVRRLRKPAPSISALAFSSDGRTLAAQAYTEGREIVCWEVASGKQRRSFVGPGGAGDNGNRQMLAFSADGTVLASGNGDTTVLIWDVADRLTPKRTPLKAKELHARWAELAGDDAVTADEAIRALAAFPKQTIPFVRQRLRPAMSADPQRLAPMIAALDSDHFAVRKQAAADLEKLGEFAEPALRKALVARPSAEVRRRIKLLLDKAWQASLSPSGDNLRAERALEVLEHIGTPEARRVLETLAKGAPEARLTQEAKASLGRLARRQTLGL